MKEKISIQMLPIMRWRIGAENFIFFSLKIVFDANSNEIECIKRLLTFKKNFNKSFQEFQSNCKLNWTFLSLVFQMKYDKRNKCTIEKYMGQMELLASF